MTFPKSLIAIAFVAIFGFWGCSGTTHKQIYSYRNPIDVANISKIYIHNIPHPTDTTTKVWKHLTNKQIKSFVEKWNDSRDSEPRIYLPSYEIDVYFKKEPRRNFRIGGKFIKENSDWCINYDDEKYFNTLYKESASNSKLPF